MALEYHCGDCGALFHTSFGIEQHRRFHCPATQKQKAPTEDKPDMVNNPPHYTQGGTETIDYLKAKLSTEEFKGFLRGNVLKYMSRAGLKGGLQDFEKAQWYLDRLIKEFPKIEAVE